MFRKADSFERRNTTRGARAIRGTRLHRRRQQCRNRHCAGSHVDTAFRFRMRPRVSLHRPDSHRKRRCECALRLRRGWGRPYSPEPARPAQCPASRTKRLFIKSHHARKHEPELDYPNLIRVHKPSTVLSQASTTMAILADVDGPPVEVDTTVSIVFAPLRNQPHSRLTPSSDPTIQRPVRLASRRYDCRIHHSNVPSAMLVVVNQTALSCRPSSVVPTSGSARFGQPSVNPQQSFESTIACWRQSVGCPNALFRFQNPER